MNYPAYSPNYTYHRLGYPEELHGKCPICGAPVIFRYPDAGKLVFCLDETINQVVELYNCTNLDCVLNAIVFNPTPRFDYGTRRWGKDVVRFIAQEFLPPLKLKPEQILIRLHREYPDFKISLDTIERICDDILLLKSFQIDEKTRELILRNGVILLGFDAQDPGGDGPGVWTFMDLLTGRILSTIKFDSIDYVALHQYLEELFQRFPVKIIGWVSDKQNVITKCHDTYYTSVPHQYCQYHFVDHLWDHLATLDSQVFIPLKKCLEGLYIHKASASGKVFFEGVGEKSPREVFKLVDKDFQMMIKAHNKAFTTLRGEWIFETLDKYVSDMEIRLRTMDKTDRFTKISHQTATDIREVLESVRKIYIDVKQMHSWFDKIRLGLSEADVPWQARQEKIDLIFGCVFHEAQRRDPKFTLESCKALQKSKKHNIVQILGEWCRLWNSYLPGLFKYEEFPGQFRTNNLLEHAFSLEKQALIARVGKGIVRHMIETRAEPYLRLTHCTPEELANDITNNLLSPLVAVLRDELKASIHMSTARWWTMSREYIGFQGVSLIYAKKEDGTQLCQD